MQDRGVRVVAWFRHQIESRQGSLPVGLCADRFIRALMGQVKMGQDFESGVVKLDDGFATLAPDRPPPIGLRPRDQTTKVAWT